MQRNGGPITECPICHYDLNGLPRDHACPECGFAYDARMRIWKGMSGWAHFFGVLLAATIILNGLQNIGSSPRSGSALEFIAGLFMVAFGCVIAYVGWRLRPHSPLVIVGAWGIHFRAGASELTFVPYQELRVAQGSTRILIFKGEEPEAFELPFMNFRRRQCDEVREYLVQCWESALGKQAEPIAWNEDWYAKNVIVIDRDGRMRRPRPDKTERD